MATKWFESIDLMYALIVEAHVLIVEPVVSQAEDALPVDPELQFERSARPSDQAHFHFGRIQGEELNIPARLIRKFPCEDRWFVDIAPYELFDIVLVRRDDGRVRVERVVRAARVELADIDVHSAVVRPVVRQRDDEPDAVRLRGRDDSVEAGDTEVSGVEGRDTVLPELVVSAVILGACDIVETPIQSR